MANSDEAERIAAQKDKMENHWPRRDDGKLDWPNIPQEEIEFFSGECLTCGGQWADEPEVDEPTDDCPYCGAEQGI